MTIYTDFEHFYNNGTLTQKFFIELFFILAISEVMHQLVFKRLKQQALFSQVLTGIIMGKSVLSQFENFNTFILPSYPNLKIIANFGKIIYMMLIGLQLDLVGMKSAIYKSRYISIVGLIVPVGVGMGISELLLQSYADNLEGSLIPYFRLFVSFAMSVTALPVLAHILAYEDLNETMVGEASLSAALVDDLVAWAFLAFANTIVHDHGSYINLGVVLGLALVFILTCWFIFRPLLQKLLSKYDGSSEVTFLIIILMFGGAVVFQIVGINSFLGSFLVGLCIPKLESKSLQAIEGFEDLVQYFFIPIYFSYIGMKTRFDLFTATDWGVCLLITVTAFVSKTLGCAIAANFTRLNVRESVAVGILMNSKG